MKKFEFPEILITEFDIDDVITTSIVDPDEEIIPPTKGDNSLGWA